MSTRVDLTREGWNQLIAELQMWHELREFEREYVEE